MHSSAPSRRLEPAGGEEEEEEGGYEQGQESGVRGQRSGVRTHPDRGSVGALDGGRVEAREEGAITHRVTLSEHQRTRLTTGQL